MHKNFDSWNKKSKEIHTSEFRGFVHEREIWALKGEGIRVKDKKDFTNRRCLRRSCMVGKVLPSCIEIEKAPPAKEAGEPGA